MRETWVQSLGWEGPLEKGKATHSNILDWRISHKESDTNEWLSLSLQFNVLERPWCWERLRAGGERGDRE